MKKSIDRPASCSSVSQYVPGGIPLYGLYGDVPVDRVWLLTSLS